MASESLAPTDGERTRPVSDAPSQADTDKIDHASLATTDVPATEPPRLSLSTTRPLSLADVQAVIIRIRDLSVTVDTSPSWLAPSTYPQLLKENFRPEPSRKSLLHSVSAELEPGTLTAILGGSGSGKTTLLNTLSERLHSPRLGRGGLVTFNDQAGVACIRSSYVMQQDVLLPTLTVRETLTYSADLRLPRGTTAADRARVVEEVILELGLKECADTRIGDGQHKGCSGGEKRRVSIGVQLLANPSVLFLDEPTTGLDATSAHHIIATLKSLAQKGRTIITTIHQPRSEIWDLFDNLIVLTRGSPVYSGPMKDCVPWFEQLDYRLPPFVNPAEFVIDMAAVDNRSAELEEESTSRVERLKGAWGQESARRYPVSAGEKTEEGRTKRKRTEANSGRKHASFGRQVQVLTDRTFKVTYRDPMGMAAVLLEAVLMGLTTGYIFYDLGRDLSGIRSRQGALYTAAGLQGYLMLIFETYRLTIDIPTYDREASEGCASPLPFLISRRLARLFTEDFPVPFLFSAIFYFMADFERDPSKFFIFLAITLLSHYIAMTCAMTCVAAIRHFPGASLIANLIFTLQSLACGMFIQSESIPVYVRWLKWITYTYYSFGAYCGNEFEDNFYDCPLPGGRENPGCTEYTGAYIMDLFGFPSGDWVTTPTIALLAFVIFFLVTSTVLLYFNKVEMTISRARVSDTDLSAGKEKMRENAIAEVRSIDVGLDSFGLDLQKRTALGKKLPTKTILHPVNATFQAGVLNVIMGPSGSGKTSLLNSMALRLHSTLGTKYMPSGKLTFNSAVPAPAVIRSVCSYVCQDDDALLPSLTVRETLRFAAGLRLPSWMSKEEKNRRAEEVLLKMGLKDCADNLIGSELIKGISGGEKRRVTIAVQVLTDPRVLMLDEPTSGLDAFTAGSIMEVLQGLAAEGRTLILTIHQARTDLFTHFGNVLLLARGGYSVYAGRASEMLGYYRGLGYECPRHTNPADFVMDLVSVDLREQGREIESREKVQRLVDSWKKVDAGEKKEERLPDIRETDEEKDAQKEEIKEKPTIENDGKKDGSAEADDEIAPMPLTKTVSPIPRRSANKTALSTPAELGALVTRRAPFSTAFPILLHRAFINIRRQPPLLLARTIQVLSLGILFTLFFAPLDNDFVSVQNRMGFVQEVTAFYFVGMLQNVAVYPAERDVFYREDDDGVYGVEAFLGVYTLLEVPFELVSCLAFGVLAVFAVGLPHTVEMGLVTTFACFSVVSCGESLGIMFNSLFGHTGFAVNLTSIFLSIANVMAGVLSTDMPPLLDAVNYLSPARYAVRAMAPYSLRGVRFTCADDQKVDGRCSIETGEDVLELYRLNSDAVTNIGAMAACIVLYRLIAWALLRLVRMKGWHRPRRPRKDA